MPLPSVTVATPRKKIKIMCSAHTANNIRPAALPIGSGTARSWQLADANVFELNRRAFGFHAQVTRSRFRAVAARNLFAVHPQPQFAVDGADVVMIPLVNAFAEVLAREAARTVGRQWRE